MDNCSHVSTADQLRVIYGSTQNQARARRLAADGDAEGIAWLAARAAWVAGRCRHAWSDPVCNDSPQGAFYSRSCQRRGLVETALQPGGPWEAV